VNDQFVPDTHALFFYLTDSSKLKAGAKAVFNRFDNGEVTLLIPWIVVAELFWLVRKLASSMDFNVEFQKLRNHPQIIFIGLDAEQVLNFSKLDKVTEMHDRIIVGVAYKFGIPLITRDQNIKDSSYVTTIWN
jgi:PIN domain nuclease of toxin-antitoxin system